MKRKKKANIEHTMDVILIVLGIALAVFTIAMIIVFCLYQSVPDTLVGCVFGAITGECGFMALIKGTKERQETRRWELEDRKLDKMQANLERMVTEDE